jgi:hypothetical protein
MLALQLPCSAANGTTYTSAAQHPYVLDCGLDIVGSDLVVVNATSYVDCIAACDTYQQSGLVENWANCVAASWRNPAFGLGNCYLKYQITTFSPNPNIYSAHWAGYVVGSPPDVGTPFVATAVSSKSSSTATATATTTAAPSSSAAPGTLGTTASTGLSTGATIGIGVGIGIAGLLFLLAVIFYLLGRRRRRRLLPAELGATEDRDRARRRGNGFSEMKGEDKDGAAMELRRGRGGRLGGRAPKKPQEMMGHEGPELQGDEYAVELDGDRPEKPGPWPQSR